MNTLTTSKDQTFHPEWLSYQKHDDTVILMLPNSEYGRMSFVQLVNDFSGIEGMTYSCLYEQAVNYIGYTRILDIHYDTYADGIFIKLGKEA